MSQIKVNSIVPIAGVPTGGGGGIVQTIQTQSNTHVSIAANSSGTSQTTPTELSAPQATITPTSTSSKVLVRANLMFGLSKANYLFFYLFRNDSEVTAAHGTSAGTSAFDMWGHHSIQHQSSSTGQFELYSINLEYLDSPSSTSALTYDIRLINFDATFFLNRNNDSNGTNRCATSYLTLQEVSA
tara:strand:- start:279 stop:833 length:555 start_codon:yes stop_codon:yes gene_type:complete